MICARCGLPLEQSELVNSTFLVHMASGAKDVLRALACPLFGAAVPKIPANVPTPSNGDDELEIPAVYRTKAHFTAMWRRSP